MPDFVWVQGDVLPIAEDTLSYTTGEAAKPESVEFVMRALTSPEAVALKGTATVVNKEAGTVTFSPTAADTAVPGDYVANWVAKINKKQMAFPTTGYLWVKVQENLTTVGGAQLIGLPEVKDYCNIQANDRTHDSKLIAQIEGVAGPIENIVGPVRLKVHDEWYDGGHATIGLKHVPSYGYGSSPVFTLMAVSEYRGPIEYPLAIVPTPSQGSVYSTMFYPEEGIIVRRTSGGGTTPFWRDPNHPKQSVHVVYASGQEAVPSGVKLAALETIRVSYENTMLVGRGFQTVADQQEPQMPLGFAIPRHAMEYLEPYRRAPAFA